jgi:hypothetical protein
MPVNYLSRLPATEMDGNINSIVAFDPFQTNLYELQMKDETLQTLQKGISVNKWLDNLPKSDCNYLQILAERVFQDKNKIMWVRLNNFNYPRMVLYLP